MAIATMEKLTLIGLIGEKQQLFDAVLRTQCAEFGEVQEIEHCTKRNAITGSELENAQSNIKRLGGTIKYITEITDQVNNTIKDKKQRIKIEQPPMTAPKYELDYAQFKDIAKLESEVFAVADEVELLRKQLADNLASSAKLAQEREKLLLYQPLDMLISDFKDTRTTYYALGTVPKENYDSLSAILTGNDFAEMETLSFNTDYFLISIICHKSEKELWDSLPLAGFVKTKLELDVLPKYEIERLDAKIADLEEKRNQTMQKIIGFGSEIKKFKLLSDYMSLQLKEADVDNEMQKTNFAYVCSLFIPKEKEETVLTAIKEATENIFFEIEEIGEEEQAPILSKNGKFVKPFEMVTNSYSPQSYHEPDPNPIMSIFYFLIFGMMTADMGYGLVLVIIGLLARRFIKQETGIKTMLCLFGNCGYATILFGFIYGGFFAADVSAIIPNCPDWYPFLPSPMDVPILTMVLSLVLGIFHIMAGIFSNARKMAKRGDVLGVIFDACVWEIFFIGLLLLAATPAIGMILQDTAGIKQPHILNMANWYDTTMIGLGAMGFALLVVLFTAGRGNKGIIGKVKGGLGGIYGVINYFADTVSYVRIFGLMLSGAVFGLIVNQLSTMIMTGVFGYVFGVLILIAFHTFNLILSLLGVYVHNARLQYVEFFGKFFEGDGKIFVPYGSDLENTLIK